jgi:hypothetical protein
MEEQKQAFDLKDLAAKLRAAGLPIAEEAAHACLNSVFEWLKESVEASPSKLDDFALALLPPLKSFIDSKIEGISK